MNSFKVIIVEDVPLELKGTEGILRNDIPEAGTAGCVQQVLCTQNVSLQEKLRVVDAAVHMAFGCEVHDIVELVIREQLIGQTAVANITFYEVAGVLHHSQAAQRSGRKHHGRTHNHLRRQDNVRLLNYRSGGKRRRNRHTRRSGGKQAVCHHR